MPYLCGMPRHWLHALLALLVLALAGGQPPAMALPTADAAAAGAVAACHGPADMAAADEHRPGNERQAPACCPDGCPGHCLLVAALPPAPLPVPAGPAPAEVAVWAPTPLLSMPSGPAERPPRA